MEGPCLHVEEGGFRAEERGLRVEAVRFRAEQGWFRVEGLIFHEELVRIGFAKTGRHYTFSALHNFGFWRACRGCGVHSRTAWPVFLQKTNNIPTNSPVPTSYGLLLPWLQNFSIKFPVHGPGLAYTAPQISAAQADCSEAVHFLLNVRAAMQRDAQEMEQYIKLKLNGPIGAAAGPMPVPAAVPAAPPAVAPGILPRLRALVGEVKGKAAYTPSIGADLNIVVIPPTADASPPTLTIISPQSGAVSLKWSKQGWDGVKVQARVPGAMAWTDLGTDAFSPYVDTRPLAAANTPEVREYRMCHLDGDDALNNWSDVLVVNVNV